MGPHYRRLLRQWRLGSGTRSGPPAISWPPSVVKERNRNLTLVVASDVLTVGRFFRDGRMSKSPALNELLMRPSKRRLLTGPNKHIPAWLLGPREGDRPPTPMHPYGRNAAVCQCERRDMRPRISSRRSQP